MADAILSRGAKSVTIPLLGQGQSLAVARDVGKPTMRISDVGREDPRSQDNLNAGDGFTLAGLLTGANAYEDAQTLAEALIKPRATTGTPLQLDISDLPSRSTYDVAPTTESALTLAYTPGRLNMVGVQLTLSVVSQTIGGSQNARSTTSPDSGSGIKIERNGTSVTFDVDQNVTRTVGRPGAKLNPNTGDLPILIDDNDPAADSFEISAELTGANAESDANTLEETITRARLGNDTLTLHFLSNLWGLDAYPVVPTGSQALRTLFRTGETGVVGIPKLELRVIDNS